MERVIVITDSLSRELYAMVVEKARVLTFTGISAPGKQWAQMRSRSFQGRGSLDQVLEGLDYNFFVEGPKAMTRQLRAQLLQSTQSVPDVGEEQEIEPMEEVESKGFGTDFLLSHSDSNSWRSQLNYKALAWQNDTYVSTIGFEFKIRKPLPFDLPNGGRGFRCAPGMANGGAFSDRYGRNCGEAAARRIINAMGSLGEGTRLSRRSGRPSPARSGGSGASGRTSRRLGVTQVASRRGSSAATTPMGANPRSRRVLADRNAGLARSFANDRNRLKAAKANKNSNPLTSLTRVSEIQQEIEAIEEEIPKLRGGDLRNANMQLRHKRRMASGWQDLIDKIVRSNDKISDRNQQRSISESLMRYRRSIDDELIEMAEEAAPEQTYRTMSLRFSRTAAAEQDASLNSEYSPQQKQEAALKYQYSKKATERFEILAESAGLDSEERAARRSEMIKDLLLDGVRRDSADESYYAEDFDDMAVKYRRESTLRSEWIEDDEDLDDFGRKFNELVAAAFLESAEMAEAESALRKASGNVRPKPTPKKETVTAKQVTFSEKLVGAIRSRYRKEAKRFDEALDATNARRRNRVGDMLSQRYGDGQPPPWLKDLASEDELWTELTVKGLDISDPYESVNSDFIYNWANSVWGHEELRTDNFTFRTRVTPEGISAYAEDGEIYINGLVEAFDEESDEWREVGSFMRRISEAHPGTVFSEELKLGSGTLYILRDSEGQPLRDEDGNYLRRDNNLTSEQKKDIKFGDKVRGDGFASLFNGHAFTLLGGSGFTQAEVNAVDDGAYVWGRVGYRSESPEDIELLVNSMRKELASFRAGRSSILADKNQAELIEYLIELSSASNFSYDSPQWPEFITALTESAVGGARSRQVREWFQNYAPFDRGTLPFTPDLVAFDPRRSGS